jgi:enterobactin synthetase component D
MIGPKSLHWAMQSLIEADAAASGLGLAAYALNLADSRRRAYLAGRVAAARSLQAIGATDWSVGRGDNGAPIWPIGYCGSITHDGDLALATTVASCRLRSVGIDLQRRFEEDSESARAVRRYALANDDAALALALLFALKEAAYKCLSAIGIEAGLRELRVLQRPDLRVRAGDVEAHAEIAAFDADRCLAVVWIPNP